MSDPVSKRKKRRGKGRKERKRKEGKGRKKRNCLDLCIKGD